ncbi:MAG: hypothetical protein JNM68_02430 [Dinghuibacter sp.]|nr:hypothetical protein [Dinghuibacter sp.]
MRYVIPALFPVLFFISCNKDKFDTKPTLKLKEINTKVVNRGEVLRFSFNVTDEEGDLTDSLFIFKVTRNCVASDVATKYAIPVFPTNKKLNVDLDVAFAYRNNTLGLPALPEPQCLNRNDSCFFRFVIRDKAGNKSDTVNTGEIVILKP